MGLNFPTCYKENNTYLHKFSLSIKWDNICKTPVLCGTQKMLNKYHYPPFFSYPILPSLFSFLYLSNSYAQIQIKYCSSTKTSWAIIAYSNISLPSYYFCISPSHLFIFIHSLIFHLSLSLPFNYTLFCIICIYLKTLWNIKQKNYCWQSLLAWNLAVVNPYIKNNKVQGPAWWCSG